MNTEIKYILNKLECDRVNWTHLPEDRIPFWAPVNNLAIIKCRYILTGLKRFSLSRNTLSLPLFPYIFTTCSRVFLQKLTAFQLVKKFLAIYGT